MVRHIKNLAADAARFLSVSDHFGILCIKRVKEVISEAHLNLKIRVHVDI